MKKTLSRFLKRNPQTSRQGIAFCGILLLMCVLSTSVNAQTTWTTLYPDGPTAQSGITHKNEAILQDFDHLNPNTILSDGRTIMIRGMRNDAVGVAEPIHIVLLREDGFEEPITQNYFFKQVASSDEYVPIASSYNPDNGGQYIITGYADMGMGTHDIWYLVLDANLDFISSGSIGGVNSGNADLFVTDMCVSNNPQASFALVGKVNSNGWNNAYEATQDAGSGTFQMEINVDAAGNVTVQDYAEITFNNLSGPASDRFFPSSIIEIENPGGPNGGYFICGAIPTTNMATDWSHVYLRTGYDLSTNTTSISGSCYRAANNGVTNPQQAFLGPTGDVYIAGLCFNVQNTNNVGTDAQYFFDKIVNVSGTAPNAMAAPLSDNWDPGNPLNPDYVPTVYFDYATSNVNFVEWPTVEGIFSMPTSGNPDEVHIGARLKAAHITTTKEDVPLMFSMDFSNTNFRNSTPFQTGWTDVFSQKAALYPRVDHNLVGTHSNAEFDPWNFLAPLQQSIQTIPSAPGVPDFHVQYTNAGMNLQFSNHHSTLVQSDFANPANGYSASCSQLDENLIRDEADVDDYLFGNVMVSAPGAPTVSTYTDNTNGAGNMDYVFCPGVSFKTTKDVASIEEETNAWVRYEHNYLKWSGDLSAFTKIELYNLSGQRLATISGQALTSQQYDMSSLSEGLYIVRQTKADNSVVSTKIIH